MYSTSYEREDDDFHGEHFCTKYTSELTKVDFTKYYIDVYKGKQDFTQSESDTDIYIEFSEGGYLYRASFTKPGNDVLNFLTIECITK